MSDTQVASQVAKSDTRWILNEDLYRQQTGAKGAVTPTQRRKVAGLSRSTEYRWKNGTTVPDWQKARKVAALLDVDVNELIVEVAA